jgi:hypothetical protein
MLAPVENNTLTSEQQLNFAWQNLQTVEETGGVEILSYNLQWDKGTHGTSWFDIVGAQSNYIDFDYTVTSEVLAGKVYQVKVRARNFWGWSAFSPALSIKASTWPEQVKEPSTKLDVDTGNIELSWQAPHDGSDAITRYKVLGQHSNGEMIEIC